MRPTKRFVVSYDDGPMVPIQRWSCFAYDADHALDRFYADGIDWGDVISVDRPRTPRGKVDRSRDRKA